MRGSRAPRAGLNEARRGAEGRESCWLLHGMGTAAWDVACAQETTDKQTLRCGMTGARLFASAVA